MMRGIRKVSCAITACVILVAVGQRSEADVQASEGISADEQKLLSALDVSRALTDLKRLTEEVIKTPSGVGNASIVSGSIEESAMAEDIAESFKKMGLEVRTEEFPVRAYRYDPVTLRSSGAAVAAISLHATGTTWGRRDGVDFARGNEAGGHRLHAALIDAGSGYAADYARIGTVRGKAVLVRRELLDWPQPQITEAASRGAAAIIFYDYPSSGAQVDALRQDSLWGHEQLPTVAISVRSAKELQRRLAAGPVPIELENHMLLRDGTSRNVVATLRGTDHPDEWVMVSAHFDRWFQGAVDDTSGVAALLAVARAFTGANVHPRRSILFVATGSEEAGLEDPERDWLAGSYAFVLQHPEVMRNAALIFNLDGFGWTAAKSTLIASPDNLAHQQSLLADLGLASQISVKPTIGSTTDAWNFGVLGGAALNSLISIDAGFFQLYHTQMDVFRPERFSNMGAHLRVLALSLKRAADEARLPIALTAVADFLDARLVLDAGKVADVSFADVRTALAKFRKAAAVIEADRDSTDVNSVNRLLMATRHTLVPWLYTDNGNYEQGVRTTVYADRVTSLDHALAAAKTKDRGAALKDLREFYEGRQCQLLSPDVYAYERNFWAGEGGWSSRFQHRAPPPPPAFEAGCRALLTADDEWSPVIAEGLAAARSDAVSRVADSITVMTAKLRAATDALTQFRSIEVPH
ncbi:MAG: M28 family metallopeptidase [Gammaproteobacteria bacterium]